MLWEMELHVICAEYLLLAFGLPGMAGVQAGTPESVNERNESRLDGLPP